MIRVTSDIAIDEKSITETFVRSSGPGGQNVNKVATAVQLRFDTTLSGLPGDIVARLCAIAGRRMTQQGELLITAQRFRTQERNRQAALEMLIGLIQRAVQPPVRRVATRPPAGSKQRRRLTKLHRARVKQLRTAPRNED